MCVPVLTVVYTLINWNSNRIPILTFNQRYDFGVVEVMSITNLEIGIWPSGETSLDKTLVGTYLYFFQVLPFLLARLYEISLLGIYFRFEKTLIRCLCKMYLLL